MQKLERTAIIFSWLLIIFFVSGSVLERLDTGNTEIIPTEFEIITITWSIIFICINIMLFSGPREKDFQHSRKTIISIVITYIILVVRLLKLPVTREDLTGKLDIRKFIKNYIYWLIIMIIPSILTIIYIFYKTNN